MRTRSQPGTYKTITGRSIDLRKLDSVERRLVRSVVTRVSRGPEWSEFATWWMSVIGQSRIPEGSVVHRICDDLEARLGIAQGKVAPPEYRDYVSALIEERFGSRYKFCRKAHVDQGQLSRVLSGRADLSLWLLQRVLKALDARLVVQPEEAVRENFGPEEAKRALAGIAP